LADPNGYRLYKNSLGRFIYGYLFIYLFNRRVKRGISALVIGLGKYYDVLRPQTLSSKIAAAETAQYTHIQTSFDIKFSKTINVLSDLIVGSF
jgi:hypothetical protein